MTIVRIPGVRRNRRASRYLVWLVASCLSCFVLSAAQSQTATNDTPHATAQLLPQKPSLNLPTYRSYLQDRMFWQGEVVLHGQKWRVGGADQSTVDPNHPRSLGLLFFQLAEPTNAPNLSPAWCVSPVPNLVLNDHAYRLAWSFDQSGPGRQLSLTFYDESPPLAQVKVEGADIRRLQFNGQKVVLVENPGPIVQVPVDTYVQVQVTVGKANQAARFSTLINQPLTVSRDQPNVLSTGGPLTNHLEGSWRGRSLRLEYQLLGAGGQVYRPADLSQPPRYAISLNGRSLSAGDFQYG